jgi:mono/diheme cytochrome c family protein
VAVAMAVLAAGCGGGSDAGRRTTTTPGQAHGRELFVRDCGSCHALRDAGTHGVVGKDLDRTRPSRALVLRTLQHPPQNMPADLVTGADARAVADYVAGVAGG